MSGWRFRRTRRVGPLRLTLTGRGLSASVGVGPVRFTRAADGSRWRTIHIPGTGVFRRDRLS